MRPARAQPVDWKIALAGRLVRAVSLTNTSAVVIVCYIIWKCTPNPILAVVLACSLTTIFLHLLNNIMNLLGWLFMVLDPLLGTDICSVLTHTYNLLFEIHGKVLHGYEIIGKENLPKDGGGLIVYQHHMLPYDLFYLMSNQYFEFRRSVTGVMHRDMAMISPGTCKLLNFTAKKHVLIERLKQGGICTVAPGGGFEAMFGRNYELLWDGRIGFATVAKECGVPIIPMFTANGYHSMPIKIPFFREFFKEVYEKTRQVFFIPILFFPVKLRIYLGEPIFCGADESPEELAKRTETAIYNLRDKYQHPDATTWSAFLERFGYRLPSASNQCATQM